MLRAFTCDWPDDLDHYTFATTSSIISKYDIDKTLTSDTATSTRQGVWYMLK